MHLDAAHPYVLRDVTIVVATRNRWPDLRVSLPRHEAPVVVVDNASTDGTPDLVRTQFPGVRVVALERNVGAVARNVGVRAAGTPYVAFADDDSWWAPGSLERAAQLMRAFPHLGLLAGQVLVGETLDLDPTCAALSASPLGTPPELPGPSVLGFVACAAVVRRDAFLQAGGFDDVIGFMGEEERLALDLAALGWGLAYVDGASPTTTRRRPVTHTSAGSAWPATSCSPRCCAARGPSCSRWRHRSPGRVASAGKASSRRPEPCPGRSGRAGPSPQPWSRPAAGWTPAGQAPSCEYARRPREATAATIESGRLVAGDEAGEGGDHVTRNIDRAVVTGGAGFLGSHLCTALLERGVEVVCLDNFLTGTPANVAHLMEHPGFRLVRSDITEFVHVPGPVDLVLHFASPASPIDYLQLPIQTLKVGALGTWHALGLAKEKEARFLLASTSEVYGDPLVHPQPEDYWGNVNPVGPRGVYDEGKRYGEALTTAYRTSEQVETAIVRIFNTYGPRMRPEDGRAIPTFIRQALAGEPLTVAGDGLQTRSICFVDDLVAGVLAMAEATHAGPVNLGNPTELTVLDIARDVVAFTGSRSPIVHVDRPVDDPQVRRPDTTLAATLLGWEPAVPWEQGLAETVAWFEREQARPA